MPGCRRRFPASKTDPGWCAARNGSLPLLPNQEALQLMVDLAQAQGGWPAVSAFRQTWGKDAQQAFLTGRLAMQYDLPNWAGDVVGKYQPDLAFGVAAPPVKRVPTRPGSSGW